MLEQLLKIFFESDSTAFPESESKINAEVLSLIEREKPMKKFRIKPLIIAAAVTAVGLSTVVLSVSALVDKNTLRTSRVSAWTDEFRESLLKTYDGDEEAVKGFEEHVRRHDIASEYYWGKTAEAFDIEKIIPEKELDETDVTGYVEPRRVISTYTWNDDETKEVIEFIKQIEQDPESLGLTPIGKTETFEGGLRIVNRHYENTSEPVDGWRDYYSLRRVYTDDAENRLLASMYYVGSTCFPEDENHNEPFVIHYASEGNNKVKLNIVLDHTEKGCLYGFEKASEERFYPNCAGTYERQYDDNGKGICSLFYVVYRFKSNLGEASEVIPVNVGTSIAVRNDWVQILD